MRRGLFLPPFGELADPRVLAELAVRAEDAGWDGVFLWDHLVYGGVTEITDPSIALAAVASATSRIELGTMVTPLVRRRPAVLARQAVALDLLSEGRLVLGFGIGDDGYGELSKFGELTDAPERGRALSEGLEVLRGLLSGDRVVHDGAHYRADDVEFLPRPLREGGIPIWLAARWPNAAPLRRAARYDGVFVISLEAPDQVTALRERLEESGADLARFDVVTIARPDADPSPWADAGVTWLLASFGPRSLVADELRAVIDAGPRGAA